MLHRLYYVEFVQHYFFEIYGKISTFIGCKIYSQNNSKHTYGKNHRMRA